MTRYRLPAEWGGAEVEGAAFSDRAVRFVLGEQEVFLPYAILTEVPPPIPGEPGPGTYDIDGQVVVGLADDERDDDGLRLWSEAGDAILRHWPAIWARYGGPGVVPQPLVAPPAVELPAKIPDVLDDRKAVVEQRRKAGTVILYVNDQAEPGRSITLDPPGARAVAYALLAAAGPDTERGA